MKAATRVPESALQNLKSAIDVYRRLVGAQFRAQMQYRLSFVVDLVAQFFGNILEFVAVALFYTRFPSIGGWSLGEIGLLFGMSSVSFALADMFSAGFDYAYFGPVMVRLGEFDRVLVRPVSAVVQVAAAQFSLKRLGRIAQGMIILIGALTTLHVTWTPPRIVYLILTIAAGIFFFMGLFIFGSGVSFWTVDGLEAMNVVTYGGQTMVSYPMHIYQAWLRSIFMFIVPMAFVNYYPALYLLDKPDPLGGPTWLAFIAPMVCVIVFLAGLRMWWFGVSKYTSTGS